MNIILWTLKGLNFNKDMRLYWFFICTICPSLFIFISPIIMKIKCATKVYLLVNIILWTVKGWTFFEICKLLNSLFAYSIYSLISLIWHILLEINGWSKTLLFICLSIWNTQINHIRCNLLWRCMQCVIHLLDYHCNLFILYFVEFELRY